MRSDTFKAVVKTTTGQARVVFKAQYAVDEAVTLDIHDHGEESLEGLDIIPVYDTTKMKFTMLAGPYALRASGADIFNNNKIRYVSKWPLPALPTE